MKLGQEMVRWMRWHCPPDAGLSTGGLKPSTLTLGQGGSPQYCISMSRVCWGVTSMLTGVSRMPQVWIQNFERGGRWKLGCPPSENINVGVKQWVFSHLMPSKHETFTRCWYSIGPASQTVGQQCTTLVECLVFAGHLIYKWGFEVKFECVNTEVLSLLIHVIGNLVFF